LWLQGSERPTTEEGKLACIERDMSGHQIPGEDTVTAPKLIY